MLRFQGIVHSYRAAKYEKIFNPTSTHYLSIATLPVYTNQFSNEPKLQYSANGLKSVGTVHTVLL
jgi:hypothetical protein